PPPPSSLLTPSLHDALPIFHLPCLSALQQQVRCVPASVIVRVDRLAWSLQPADDVAGFDGIGAETTDSLHQANTIAHGVVPVFLVHDSDEFAGIDIGPVLKSQISVGH